MMLPMPDLSPSPQQGPAHLRDLLAKAQDESSWSLPSSVRRLLYLMPELIALYEDAQVARAQAQSGFDNIQPRDKQYALMTVKDLLSQRLHALDLASGVQPPLKDTIEPPAV